MVSSQASDSSKSLGSARTVGEKASDTSASVAFLVLTPSQLTLIYSTDIYIAVCYTKPFRGDNCVNSLPFRQTYSGYD
jgi:hypothetical protein